MEESYNAKMVKKGYSAESRPSIIHRTYKFKMLVKKSIFLRLKIYPNLHYILSQESDIFTSPTLITKSMKIYQVLSYTLRINQSCQNPIESANAQPSLLYQMKWSPTQQRISHRHHELFTQSANAAIRKQPS